MISLCFSGISLMFGVALYAAVIVMLLTWNLMKKNTKQLDRFLTTAGISSLLIILLILLFLFFYAYLGCDDSWWVELLIIFIGLPLTYSFANTESKKPHILSARVIKYCRLFGLVVFATGSIFTFYITFLLILENYF